MDFAEGQRVKLPGTSSYVVVEGAQPQADGGWVLFVNDHGTLAKVSLTKLDAERAEVLAEDGGGDPKAILAALWAEWMKRATQTASATALATTPLRPYPHQNRAVYGAMVPQPLLRFLLADEPGTGKTIMGGLFLREMQRLGFVRRALVVCPAHLVTKWQEDFERFLGGGLRRITSSAVKEEALSGDHDLWVVSLELAAVNPAVYEAIHPDRAGWDAVVFDEAHRMTPTAARYHRVGRMLATNTPRAVLMTATPHRGNEWLFRSLMHLVDPNVFPPVERIDDDQPASRLKPGPLHFLRRMKEELVDYDGTTRLFLSRVAHNEPVALNVDEQAFYDEALQLVEDYFPQMAHALAKMVYGKRAASALYSLAETLKRRSGAMDGNPLDAGWEADPEEEDEAERQLAQVVHEASRASREEKRAIKDLLGRIEEVLSDRGYTPSKWPRMVKECLEPNGILPGGHRQLVVFTEFADTADWLVARFTSEGYSARRYSGRDAHPVRDEIRAKFAAGEFQIIVSTDAGNEGIDLQSAHVLVNWDIPWSLVRLEQRMGRIHRVGQTEVVHLYNLVATGTREGDAHARLLDNLCAAANELEGKMFDSLSLVGDVALEEAGVGDLEKLLAKTYERDDGTDIAVKAVLAITKDRLRQVHDRERRTEDFLTSGIDMNKAIASLHEEALERINPTIVERFLARAAAAGLVTLKRSAIADEGIWIMSPGAMRLPGVLGGGGQALVATSGRAKQEVLDAGHPDAARAVALGPAEAPFRDLVEAFADRLRPELFQGGRLCDPTTVTDYDLYVFEAQADEGGGRRTVNWSYLVRVDATGARSVPWELLANLEAGDAETKALHPGRASQAETAAAAALENDLHRRTEALSDWLSDAKAQLNYLPNQLTDDISDPGERKQARQHIADAVGVRIAELESAITLLPAPLHRVGWAHVSGAGAPPAPTDKDSEWIAMQHVSKHLGRDGWHVADVHLEGRGFDLYALRGRQQRCVEVKGVWESASSQGIDLTGGELAKAGLLADDYWLYVVDQCSDGKGSLFAAYPDPARIFADVTRDKAILHIKGSDLKAAKETSAA